MTKQIKPEVGQKVFVSTTHRGKISTRWETVKKVGRKYFETERFQSKFNLSNWCNNDPNYKMKAYISEQDFQDEQELKMWEDVFRKTFDHFSDNEFTLEQYRECANILDL